ncbi:hypothetical protein, partial [Sphingobacterium daejeonense]|uniref:hypothetical protein n=1 Tax=Sphingobacterium daejeonense TaxID=371142 RepID=UPI003D322F90
NLSSPSLSYFLVQRMLSANIKGRDIKNRITINHDDGRLESFYITDEKTNVRSEKFYYWYQSRKIQRTQG